MNRKTLLPMLGCLALAACASGPKFSDAKNTIAPIPAGEGRIYFYRTQFLLGAAVQPSVVISGQSVSGCTPQGISILDAAPGSYEATVTTEVQNQADFTLAAGEEKFIRCEIGIGFLIGHGHLDVIDPGQARNDIQDLAYMGISALHSAAAPRAPLPAPAQAPTS